MIPVGPTTVTRDGKVNEVSRTLTTSTERKQDISEGPLRTSTTSIERKQHISDGPGGPGYHPPAAQEHGQSRAPAHSTHSGKDGAATTTVINVAEELASNLHGDQVRDISANNAP